MREHAVYTFMPHPLGSLASRPDFLPLSSLPPPRLRVRLPRPDARRLRRRRLQTAGTSRTGRRRESLCRFVGPRIRVERGRNGCSSSPAPGDPLHVYQDSCSGRSRGIGRRGHRAVLEKCVLSKKMGNGRFLISSRATPPSIQPPFTHWLRRPMAPSPAPDRPGRTPLRDSLRRTRPRGAGRFARFSTNRFCISAWSGTSPLAPPGSTVANLHPGWPVMKIDVAGLGGFVLYAGVQIGDQATFDKSGRANSHRSYAAYAMRLEQNNRQLFSAAADLKPDPLIAVNDRFFDMRIPLRALGIAAGASPKIALGDASWPKATIFSLDVPRYR